MEIIIFVAKWAFVVAGAFVVLAAAVATMVVGIGAILASSEIAFRRIRRWVIQPQSRPPAILRPLVRPIPRKR